MHICQGHVPVSVMEPNVPVIDPAHDVCTMSLWWILVLLCPCDGSCLPLVVVDPGLNLEMICPCDGT